MLGEQTRSNKEEKGKTHTNYITSKVGEGRWDKIMRKGEGNKRTNFLNSEEMKLEKYK